MEIQEDLADDLLESVDQQPEAACATAPPALLQVDAAHAAPGAEAAVENFEVDDDVVMRSGDRLGLVGLDGAVPAAGAER